ncbi:MAG TPA: tetratricopeptide repeat protein [Pseudonocardiaceae bacterium]|nr:tetratricopeptide repeat protein [Pseudonocardiaceae bacterium]
MTSGWVVGGAMVAAGVGVAVAARWQERDRRLAQRRDEQSWKIEEGCLVLGSGRVPRVREITDPIRLGVHPSAPAEPGNGNGGKVMAGSRTPAYVPRDKDERLRESLAQSEFVMLVGHSTVGKSRSAYEAMMATLADHFLIVPTNRDALSAAVRKTAQAKKCVLWLNDLEQFLGQGGLTHTQVTRLLSKRRVSFRNGHHRVILATLRAVEERRFTEDLEAVEDSVREMNHQVRQTLEQARRIELERLFTPAEQDRARTRAWDGRIADALEHAGEYGIAEYLAAGPELLRDLNNAWEAGANPRGAALVTAAIDCRRAGYGNALPRRLVTQVHEGYLQQRGGHRLRPESVDQAWAWATCPRRSTTALLQPVTDTDTDAVQVFDYLLDQIQRRADQPEHVPEQVIMCALRHATARDADTIASLAYTQGRYSLAERAWTQIYEARRDEHGEEHPDTLTSRNNRALALGELGRLEEAETEHRAVLQIRQRALSEEHPDTLISRNNLASVLRGLGRLEEAEAEHRAEFQICRRVLGEEHPDTLASLHNLASVLGELGRLEEAETGHRAVLQICRRVLGEEHPATLRSRNNLANVLGERGRLEEAETEHRAVLQIQRRVLSEEHPDTLTSRNNLANVLRGLGRLEEAETEHRAVLQIQQRASGREESA